MMLSKNLFSMVAALAVGFYVFAADEDAQGGGSSVEDRGLGADNVITIGSARTGISVTLGGTIVPYKMVTLNAELPGSIESIAGLEGDQFEDGEILVRIDDDTLLAKRQEVEAQLRIAEASLRNADVQYNKAIISPNYQGDAMMGGLPSMMRMFTDPMRSSGLGDGDPDFERYSDIYSRRSEEHTV